MLAYKGNFQNNFPKLHGGESTHPECATLFDPLFRFARKRVEKISQTLFPPQAKRGWSSEATTG